MRERERGDGDEQTPRAVDQEHEAENEEQVVDAAQDVLDAEPQEPGGGHRRLALALAAIGPDRRRLRAQHGREPRAVAPLDAQQHVGERELEAADRDLARLETVAPQSIVQRSTVAPAIACQSRGDVSRHAGGSRASSARRVSPLAGTLKRTSKRPASRSVSER